MTFDIWEWAAREFERADLSADPVAWGKERLGEYYWGKQRDILESLVRNRYTAVQSCHDAGKSFIAARAAAWWIDQHPPGEAFIVSTAPTAAQVSAILWREITKAHKKGGLPGNILSAGYPQWKISGGELVGYGRKPADYADSAFQGIHARYVLVVMDEACGIDKSLFDAVDALATNEEARVLAIGNPDDPGSHFANVCKPSSGWATIRIDGLRTPNMTQSALDSGRFPLLKRLMAEEGIEPNTEDVPEAVRPMLLSPLWVEERLQRWVGNPEEGVTLSQRAAQSPLFTAKVRGVFPSSGSEGVIPLGWVQRAVDRWKQWVAEGRPTPLGKKVVGVDVARGGEDETAMAIRVGRVITEIRKYQQADTMEVAGHVAALLNTPHATSVVDVIGVGAGVVDRLREQNYKTMAFNAAAGAGTRRDASGEFKFRNLRAAAWWNLREMLDPSRNPDIMLPDHEQMITDLVTPRWKVHSGGIIQIESKDDIRKRIGRSTDSGDAVVQACWTTAEPVGMDQDRPGAVSWWSETDWEPAESWGVDEMVV